MKKATSVNVRMTDQLRSELQQLADASKRTLSDYIRIILEEHAEEQKGQPEKGPRRLRGVAAQR